MFRIQRIEKSSFYADQLFKAMEEYATKEKELISERFKKTISTQRKTQDENNLNKRKDLELQKIKFLNERSNRQLRKIINVFPKFEKVDRIYIELINTSQTPVNDIKDALARLLWIGNTIDELAKNSSYKIKKTKSQETLGFIVKKFLGRFNSLYKKNKEFFIILNEASKFMNKLPKFEDIYTVSIGGFPNVGKSTLMKKLSGSDVEIQNYPFTTKGLMFGYIYHNQIKSIQLIDTPGLLGRDKNNSIEQRAQIILNNYSQLIIFVLDFTQTCGYSITEQFSLLKKLKKSNLNLILYFSKSDIYNEEDIERREEYNRELKKFEQYSNIDTLKTKLVEEMKRYGKLNIKKDNIKRI
jgi:nucleolar GTP-binding protein